LLLELIIGCELGIWHLTFVCSNCNAKYQDI
jgi:hypothetical protein